MTGTYRRVGSVIGKGINIKRHDEDERRGGRGQPYVDKNMRFGVGQVGGTPRVSVIVR